MELKNLLLDCHIKRECLRDELEMMEEIIKILTEKSYEQQTFAEKNYEKHELKLQELENKLKDKFQDKIIKKLL